MNKSVYIATTDSYSGKSLITLGVMQMIMRRTPNVGYFRPIIADNQIADEKDNHIDTMLSYFNINMQYDEAYAFTRNKVLEYKNKGKLDDVFDIIIKKYKALEDKFDFVLVEGTDFFDEGTIFELNLNASLAQNLNIPVILIVKDIYKTVDELVNHTKLQINSFIEKDNKVISAIINKSDKEKEAVLDRLKEEFSNDISFGLLPREKVLRYPTIKEIAKELDAKILYGEDKIDVIAKNFIIGAMQLPRYLNYITEDVVAIIPSDRSDLIVGTVLANFSPNYPRVGGIVLSGGEAPEKTVTILLKDQPSIPILLSNTSTYQSAEAISSIKSKIYPESTFKIKFGIDLFEKHVKVRELEKKISAYKIEGITPRMFQYNMVKKAKVGQKHIVLPEGTDDRILKAASMLAADEVVRLTILGKPDDVKKRVITLGLDWDDKRINILNPKKDKKFEDYAKTLYKLRKSKGMDMAQAKDLMQDLSYYGTMMVYKGHADGMVSGAENTTAHTIRPALQFVKTKPEVKTVSSVFFMLLKDKVLIYGDCAIIPNPTAEQLAEITISSADTAKSFGIEPKIALLSYSSGDSGSGQEVDKVRTATNIVKSIRPDLLVEGPIQYDAAVDMNVGKSKMPGSLVAGQANVLIFPDLNTGNNTYKAVQRETGGLAIGPVLQGLNKPINDLSRGAKVDDIYNTVIITAIQAMDMDEEDKKSENKK